MKKHCYTLIISIIVIGLSATAHSTTAQNANHIPAPSAVPASQETLIEQKAREITDIYLAGMMTIFEHQALINSTDSHADKEMLFGDNFIQLLKQKYQSMYTKEFPAIDSPIMAFLIFSIRQVMEENRALIYDNQVTAKGFIPAIFAFQLSQLFSNSRYAIRLKYTGYENKAYNELNQPEPWETTALTMMSAPDWPANKRYLEKFSDNGKPMVRYISPLRYEPYCMSCHGSIDESPLNVDKPRHHWINKNEFGFEMQDAQVGKLGGGISLSFSETLFDN